MSDHVQPAILTQYTFRQIQQIPPQNLVFVHSPTVNGKQTQNVAEPHNCVPANQQQGNQLQSLSASSSHEGWSYTVTVMKRK